MGLGNDICQVSRISNILSREPRGAARFVRRILTEDEIGSIRSPLVKRWIKKFFPVANEEAKDKQSRRTTRVEMTSHEWAKALRGTSNFLAGRYVISCCVLL